MNPRILSFYFGLKRTKKIGRPIFVAALIGAGLLITDNVLMALQENETVKTPSYAGFAEINAIKNHFFVVGDTQSTSR